MTFKGAELNYHIHEKETLAIICALQKWWSDLIGVLFMVYTDHKTLDIFLPAGPKLLTGMLDGVHDLVQLQNCIHQRWRQLCSWSSVAYIIWSWGKCFYSSSPDNESPIALVQGAEEGPFQYAKVMANPETFPLKVPAVATMLTISVDTVLLDSIHAGYSEDPWCSCVLSAAFLPHGIWLDRGTADCPKKIWGSWVIIPFSSCCAWPLWIYEVLWVTLWVFLLAKHALWLGISICPKLCRLPMQQAYY